MKIDEVNQYGKQQFAETLGWVFEDSPWVAERAWRHRPFASRTHLCETMKGEVEEASYQEQLALLRAHPDLGTRAKISSGSAGEQAGAGLDKLTEAEYARLMELNTAYRDKFAFPFLYNYIFLVGLMNYICGIGVALWALAGWVAVRERVWPIRLALSTVCVVALFFCHLSALGIYGVGLLSFEILRLWERRMLPGWPARAVDFVASGLPFLAAVPLLYASPTLQLISATYWDQRGKIDGLMYVIADYSDIVAFALVAVMAAGIVWAIRHHVLRFHPLVFVLMVVGGAVYFALPRIMFDTYMTDQRVPIGIAFMLFACGDLNLRHRLVRRGFLVVLIFLIAGRLIEIDLNWSQLSDSTSQFRSSVRRIAPGS